MKKDIKVFVLATALIYGSSHKRGSTPKVDQDLFDKLKGLNLVREYNEELDGVAKAADESVFEEMIETLESEKNALTEKITALAAQLEEAITLPKGQKPDGYEEV